MELETAMGWGLVASCCLLLAWSVGCWRERSRHAALEAKLNTERALLKALADGFADGLVLLDEREQILYANPQVGEMVNLAPEELVGRPFSVLLAGWRTRPTDPELKVGTAQELELKHKEGGRSWAVAEVLSARDSRHGVERRVVTIRGRRGAALEQARLLAVIENAAREWQLTFDTVESVLLVLDPDDRVRRMNRAACELAGRSYREVLGLRLEEVSPDEPWRTAGAMVSAVRRTGAASSAEAQHLATATTWDLAASLSAGSGDRIVVVATDISRVVRLQDSLRRSEVMSAMGSLVAGVAHEVRNPLFGISAALDAFESRFAVRDDIGRYLYVLRSQLNRLNHLMQQLLDYGRPQALEFVSTAATHLVDDAFGNCAPLAERGGVSLIKRVDTELPELLVDRVRLVQVLTNLLENAIHHSSGGQAVECEVERVDAAPATLVRFRVSDRGPGFAPEDLSRLFEPFFTRRREGTGLGLSIVHRIVEQHGGTIEARNRAGGGGVMEVSIPLPATDQVAERKVVA